MWRSASGRFERWPYPTLPPRGNQRKERKFNKAAVREVIRIP